MIAKEMEAFDKLPYELRYILNNIHENIDPRYIHGIYKQRGTKAAITYLEDIGLWDSTKPI